MKKLKTKYTLALHNRRRNKLKDVLRKRFDSQQELALALGLTPSYLSQIIGKNPIRQMTEDTARSFEQKLKLPAGFLDTAEKCE